MDDKRKPDDRGFAELREIREDTVTMTRILMMTMMMTSMMTPITVRRGDCGYGESV